MPPRTCPHAPSPDCPTLIEEQALARRGFRRIAGIDEAGRGSWAGPLVASAVCLPAPTDELLQRLQGVRDSKQLTPRRRAELYTRIVECAVDVGVGVVSAASVDRLGLSLAGEQAMLWAVEDLSKMPDCLLIDAFTLRDCPLHQRSMVRGDQLSLSIAAASVVAKVTRDRLMQSAERVYPGYGFGANKGYGTEGHRLALKGAGPCGFHRRSYEPLKQEWG